MKTRKDTRQVEGNNVVNRVPSTKTQKVPGMLVSGVYINVTFECTDATR